MPEMNATANGTPIDATAAGQPLPATIGHFGRLAAAVAAEQEQEKVKAQEVPREGSPEPLRVRSPGSLREPSRSPQAIETSASRPLNSSEGERRFSHEPWNWKLGNASERGHKVEEEGTESADKGQLADPTDDKIEHRGPQEQKMSESLVA